MSFIQPGAAPSPEPGQQLQYSESLTGNRGESPEEVLAHRKRDLRTLWRARRRELDPGERARQSAALTEAVLDWYLPRARHRRIAAFLSYGTEPDTGDLLEGLHAAGTEVLVPVILPERRLAWTRWLPGVELARSAVAPIDEPVGERLGLETMDTVDLLLVPALVVDPRGMRMGQGGGYYDRFLAELTRHGDGDRAPASLALLHRHELLTHGSVPAQEHDLPVDGAATADGLTWFSGAPD